MATPQADDAFADDQVAAAVAKVKETYSVAARAARDVRLGDRQLVVTSRTVLRIEADPSTGTRTITFDDGTELAGLADDDGVPDMEHP